jgi:hypothetical protein
MHVTRALEELGISSLNPSEQEVEDSFQRLFSELSAKIDNTSNTTLKKIYTDRIAAIQLAKQIILSHLSNNLSVNEPNSIDQIPVNEVSEEIEVTYQLNDEADSTEVNDSRDEKDFSEKVSSNEDDNTEKNTNKKYFILIIGLLLLVSAGLVVFQLTKDKSPKENKNNQTSTVNDSLTTAEEGPEEAIKEDSIDYTVTCPICPEGTLLLQSYTLSVLTEQGYPFANIKVRYVNNSFEKSSDGGNNWYIPTQEEQDVYLRNFFIPKSGTWPTIQLNEEIDSISENDTYNEDKNEQ